MIVVIGAGVAGLTAVQQLATAGVPVTLVTAGRFGANSVSAGNTALAQGGIAAAIGDDDSPALHLTDTIAAGAGLVDSQVAEILTTDGAHRVGELLDAGFPADRDTTGTVAFGLEAAHSKPRVLHCGEDSSGAALSAFLTNRVQQLIDDGQITLLEQAAVTQLLTTDGSISGIDYDCPNGRQRLAATAVVLATGGYAGLFPTTSSSPAVTGSGLLAAARAGAVVADLEYIQFHPTVLPATGQLLSEAVRGAGAVLRNPAGERFMPEVHPNAELAPRDIVSRASVDVMRSYDTDFVLLDATVIEHHHGPGTLATRFPQLTHTLATHGIDWTTQYVPVAPAAHYCMGGLATDTSGRTSIRGLLAVGEVASTGVHGANRLASNSLLEGLVFGYRAAQTAQQFVNDDAWPLETAFQHLIASATPVHARRGDTTEDDEQFHRLQQLTGAHLGIVRDHAGLTALQRTLDDLDHALVNLVRLITTAALARTESRGGHWRTDHPTQDPQQAIRQAWLLQTTHN